MQPIGPPQIEQIGKGMVIQVEPSEKVLSRLDKMAVGTGAAYGFLAGLIVAGLIVTVVLRRTS